MPAPSLLVTGSSGLVGSAMVSHFSSLGWAVHGVDNNQRANFFGPAGDTRWNQQRLQTTFPAFEHHELDLRDSAGVMALVATLRPRAVIHTAAQPSHDLAATRPFDDFNINAGATLALLEAMRQFCPEAPLVHLSTNKVYGDRPNRIRLCEHRTRWDYADPAYANGIDEQFPIDQSKHSLFGASKLAGDVLVQEYGRYFGMPTCCLRGGCLTGSAHSAVALHGFLGYLTKVAVTGGSYTIHGYNGKQVRDNIHAHDVARFAERFIAAPRSGEVYNIGGGRENSCSILEAFTLVEAMTEKPTLLSYVNAPRDGDHICYISDLRKAKADYPGWGVTRALTSIFEELVTGWRSRIA